MLIKIVTFFLIGIAVLALFGRLRWPGQAPRIGRRRDTRLEKPGKPKTCRHCGAYLIGKGPCPCGKG